MPTLLLAEHDNKTLKDSTNKALTAAKALGADVDVLVAGSGAKAVADAAAVTVLAVASLSVLLSCSARTSAAIRSRPLR